VLPLLEARTKDFVSSYTCIRYFFICQLYAVLILMFIKVKYREIFQMTDTISFNHIFYPPKSHTDLGYKLFFNSGLISVSLKIIIYLSVLIHTL
jgi:hypothetical protein